MRKGWSRQQVRWLVDRYHVATEFPIIEKKLRRLTKTWPAYAVREAVEYARQRHEGNREEYRRFA